ncbi:hypothetical protein [Deinococcus aquiradiocola]|uniref:Uncharacterized protein n=1 Tax=Deinococcus aquiradiocola TaxID=393059 RepID=A0A917UUH0_9DEIO|nr:hypothetical protein [Deinococcus aquiradiocola]GGJ85988.1 hypothetical protein GCM10008939_32280 [Deinococcus aquiradiocola]
MNITVFDALLVSLWAAVTALGARRGLGGAVWGVLGVAACFLVNLLAPNGLVGLVAALLLGVGAVLAARRLIREPLTETWHLLAGGLGGFALGAVLVGTLALNFPIQTVGDVRRYPSDTLPGPVYYPLYNSYIRQSLNTLWGPNGNTALRVLLIPDQQHLPAPAARRR